MAYKGWNVVICKNVEKSDKIKLLRLFLLSRAPLNSALRLLSLLWELSLTAHWQLPRVRHVGGSRELISSVPCILEPCGLLASLSPSLGKSWQALHAFLTGSWQDEPWFLKVVTTSAMSLFQPFPFPVRLRLSLTAVSCDYLPKKIAYTSTCLRLCFRRGIQNKISPHSFQGQSGLQQIISEFQWSAIPKAAGWVLEHRKWWKIL